MANTFVQTDFFTELNHPRPKVDFSKSPSKTRPEFADDADINNLLKRYSLTGSFYDPLTMAKATRKPMFGDFTKFQDFQACQNALIEAKAAFNALPVEIRAKFNYDPAKLIAWLSDDNNREEAIKLGLVEPKALKAQAAEAAKPEPPEKSGQGEGTEP